MRRDFGHAASFFISSSIGIIVLDVEHLRFLASPDGKHQGLRLSGLSPSECRPSEPVKADPKLNGDVVDAISFIAHKDKAYPPAHKL